MPITITRSDLGHPTETGEYEFEGMKVSVDSQHLKAWAEAPEASFRTILCTRAGQDQVRLTLGQLA